MTSHSTLTRFLCHQHQPYPAGFSIIEVHLHVRDFWSSAFTLLIGARFVNSKNHTTRNDVLILFSPEHQHLLMIITNHDFYQSIDKIQPSKCTERLHHGKVQSSLLETTLTITSIGIVSPEDINTCSLPQQLLPHYPFFHSLSLLSVVRLLFC